MFNLCFKVLQLERVKSISTKVFMTELANKLNPYKTYFDVSSSLLGTIIPKSVIDHHPDELQRRLGSIHILGRHVEIVHKAQQFFTTERNINTLGSLLNLTFDYRLYIVGCSLCSTESQNNSTFFGLQTLTLNYNIKKTTRKYFCILKYNLFSSL